MIAETTGFASAWILDAMFMIITATVILVGQRALHAVDGVGSLRPVRSGHTVPHALDPPVQAPRAIALERSVGYYRMIPRLLRSRCRV